MYAATVQGQRLTFEVLGVWRRNLIMRDRETGTAWQQATGAALAGPLQGARLELLGGEQTTWANWQERYPETAVSIEPPQPPQGLLSFSRLESLLDLFTTRFMTPGLNRNDGRLPSHIEVAGLTVRGESRAYPLPQLREQPIIHDTLGDKAITVRYVPDADSVTVHFENDDRPLHVKRQYWLGWSEFHPGASIWQN